MPTIRSLAPLLALAAASLGAQQVSWEPFLSNALERAAKENKVLFLALGMPGERDSEAMLARYKDRGVVDVTKAAVCCYVEVHLGESPLDAERDVLKRYFDVEPGTAILLPHQLIVQPDGETVLSSAAGPMTAGELEWFVADGIHKHDAAFDWSSSGRSRAPLGLRYDEREKPGEGVRPRPAPSREEVEEAISALKKSRFSRDTMTHYGTVLRSEEPAARKYVETQMRGGGWTQRMMLRSIGRLSPPAWAGVAVEHLGHREERTRESAARCLEALALPETLSAVRRQLRGEKHDDTRAWLLRAAARTGPTDRTVISLLEKTLKQDRSDLVRLHAAVASGVIDDGDAALELLGTALADTSAKVRAAAAYGLARRRDGEQVATLETALRAEKDELATQWIERALGILRNRRDMEELAEFDAEVLGERDPTERGGRGDAGGDGRGGDEPGREPGSDPTGGGGRGRRGGGGR